MLLDSFGVNGIATAIKNVRANVIQEWTQDATEKILKNQILDGKDVDEGKTNDTFSSQHGLPHIQRKNSRYN